MRAANRQVEWPIVAVGKRFAASAYRRSSPRGYDFFTMYALRMVYYAHWHFIWGALRLELLFGS